MSPLYHSCKKATPITHDFDCDLTLLKQHISPIILKSNNNRVLISPELQGRILIVSSSDFNNQSIGWINRDYLYGKVDKAIENIGGGADRLWFGPDGGKFSVFFEPGVQNDSENIRVPPELAKSPFKLTKQSEKTALFEKTLSFSNHLGFKFHTQVKRLVSVFDKSRVEEELGIKIPKKLPCLAYGSNTTVSNVGSQNWNTETGLFSIWSLSTFDPNATIVIPLKKPLTEVTNYLSPPSNRKIRIIDNTVFYNADANLMNKIGIPPEHTLPIIGSYDKQKNLLTIIKFQTADLGSGYVNAVWDWDAPPLKGEIVNIFNDGIQENGKSFGPFYEMETSSAALALPPNESHSHYHYLFHFSGPKSKLTNISKKLLGTSINEINNVF